MDANSMLLLEWSADLLGRWLKQIVSTRENKQLDALSFLH